MSLTCRNCGQSVGDQSALQNWDAVCRHCGQLFWLSAGDIVPCKVTRLARYGIIVELGDGVEGMIHISELAAEPPRDPGELLAVGEIVRAKVLRIDLDERQIGLSIKRAGS